MSKKLYIFDLDGVLVDACEWHRLALNKALEEVYNYQISLKEHKDTFNGIPTKKKLSILAERGFDTDKFQEVYDLKQRYTVEFIKKFSKPRAEKIELLTRIKEEGHYLACYTNSIRETAELMLESAGVLSLFDCVLTNQDVAYPKPSPEGYLFLMSKFRINKELCYIVEDSVVGLQSAYSSGANVIKVENQDEVNLELIFKGQK